jgi:hypothetical protein
MASRSTTLQPEGADIAIMEFITTAFACLLEATAVARGATVCVEQDEQQFDQAVVMAAQAEPLVRDALNHLVMAQVVHRAAGRPMRSPAEAGRSLQVVT